LRNCPYDAQAIAPFIEVGERPGDEDGSATTL
jgi:hypothetical protein